MAVLILSGLWGLTMDNIRELLSQIKLFCQMDVAIADKLEEQDKEIAILRQHNERLTASCRSLEVRYSELMLIIKSLKSDK